MEWDEQTGSYRLSTGRILDDARMGLGLNEEGHICGGEHEGAYYLDYGLSYQALTHAERTEIADYMCAQWQAWAERTKS